MVTGKHPFPGATSAVIFGNILHNSPAPPGNFNAALPAELERIIHKLLEKDRDFRYQVAAELRADLKRLRRELEPNRPISDSAVMATRATSASVSVPARSSGSSRSVSQAKPASGSAEGLVDSAPAKGGLGTGAWIGIALVALVAVVAIFLVVRKSGNAPAYLPFDKFSIENVSNNGHITQAAISPDGKYLLQALEENGQESLWLHLVATGTNKEVIAPAAVAYDGLTFSPDGNYIYFARRPENEEESELYSASALGGEPHVLLKDIDSPITFSPDGSQFAYLRERHDSPTWDLLVVKSDGTGEKALFTNRPLPSDSHVPAWSPDGKTIIIPTMQPSKDALSGFVAVDTATGKDSIVANSPDRIYYGPAWMPDGKAIIAGSTQLEAAHMQAQIAYIDFPTGSFRALTADTNNYGNIGVAKDGKTIVAIQSKLRFSISIAPANAPDQLQPIPLRSQVPPWQWNWTADGRLIVPQGGDLKIVGADGQETILYSDAKKIPDQAATCGNGKYIVFRQVGRSGGTFANLWRSDLSGANQKQLTSGVNDQEPACGNDGKWVYFVDNADNRKVKRVSVEGGSPETVVKYSVGSFALSPNGKEIASFEVRELDHKLMLRVHDIDSGQMHYADIDQRAGNDELAFAPDGKGVVYAVRDKGVDNLWLQPLDGKPRKQLTHFKTDKNFRFAFSPDGTKIALESGEVESDAVLLHDETAK
jgi:Tol biopolymer transport system component